MPNYDDRYYDQRYRPNLLHCWFGVKPGALRMAGRWQRGGRLLDVGCGTGEFLRQAQRRYQAFGVEVSPFAAAVAASNPDNRRRVVRADASRALPFVSGAFAVIAALDVVEHLPVHRTLLKECARLLADGGLLMLSTPNPSSVGRRIKGRQWFGDRDSTHVSIKPPAEWRALLAEEFVPVRLCYDWLWDAPYLGTSGWWQGAIIRNLVTVPQWLLVTLPSVALSALGLGSPPSLGENVWIYARRKPRTAGPARASGD